MVITLSTPAAVNMLAINFAPYGHPRCVFAVLSGETEIGDHSYDALGGSPLGGIDEHQQLHQVVRRRKGALDNHHFFSSHGLLNADPEFSPSLNTVCLTAQRGVPYSIAMRPPKSREADPARMRMGESCIKALLTGAKIVRESLRSIPL